MKTGRFIDTRERFAVLVIALTAFVASAWSLNAYFISDDFLLIEKAHLNLSEGRLMTLLTGCLEPWGNGFWRPLFTVWFTFQYFLFGWTPALYHFVSISIHALNAVLLFLFLRRWQPAASGLIAFFGAALFAVHPATWEAVAWISSQSELLVVTFVLVGLLLIDRVLHLPIAESKPFEFVWAAILLVAGAILLQWDAYAVLTWWLGIASIIAAAIIGGRVARRFHWRDPDKRIFILLGACLIAALLVRENGIVLGFLLLAFCALHAPAGRRRSSLAKLHGFFLFCALLYAVYGVLAWERLSSGDPSTRPDISLAPRSMGSNLLTYLGALVWPPSLAYPSIAVWSVQALGGVVLLGLCALLIWGAARHRFAAIWLFAALAPICLWFEYTPSRYIYLPSAAFCLLLAIVLNDVLHVAQARAHRFVTAANGVAALLITVVLASGVYAQWKPSGKERYFRQAEAMRELAHGLDSLRDAKLGRYEVWWVTADKRYPHEASRLVRAMAPRLEIRAMEYLSRDRFDELLARPQSEQALRNVVVFMDGAGPHRADHLWRSKPIPPGFSAFSESLGLSIPRGELYVSDDWRGMDNLVGGVATDLPDDRALAIGWNFGPIDAWEYRLYVEVNRQPPELLARTANHEQRAFEWRPGRGLVSPLLVDGPQHGESYRFIVVAELKQGRRLKIEAAAPVLYQVEGAPDAMRSPIPLLVRAWRALHPDRPFLGVTVGRDSLENLEGAFTNSISETMPLVLQWHTPHDEVKDFHIYVSVDDAEPVYFARTGDGRRTFFEWRPRAPFLEKPFLLGPDIERAYRFIVYPIGEDGRVIPGSILEMKQPAHLKPFALERGVRNEDLEF